MALRPSLAAGLPLSLRELSLGLVISEPELATHQKTMSRFFRGQKNVGENAWRTVVPLSAVVKTHRTKG